MTWKETLNYLNSALPMFQRVGPAAYKANLENTYAICKLIVNPETSFKSIHIAGTNGKGSTSHALASILQEAGYKTGLYTSPHLKDFRERIRINGRKIRKQEIIDFIATYKPYFEQIKPSFFEMSVGLAFDYFRKNKVDIAVIETGLGGRLDSTNVITPILSIITNIGHDHMNLLGDTLQKIAAEKAGIIKPGVPVIIGETQKETKNIFINTARKCNAPILFADKQITVNHVKSIKTGFLSMDIENNKKLLFNDLRIDLTGLYQVKNIKAVILARDILQNNGFVLSAHDTRNGLKQIKSSTGLKGRWQVIAKQPLTIADTGHNPEGIKEILRQIRGISYKNLHIVLGFVNDKEIDKILQLLPVDAVYYFCQANIPRAMEAPLLAEKAFRFKLIGKVIPNVKRALKSARKNAGKHDLIFVGGSTFVVAEIC